MTDSTEIPARTISTIIATIAITPNVNKATIKDAINACQPFKMLPANEFDKWEKIQLTF